MLVKTVAEPWTVERIRAAFIDDGGLSEYHDPINGARDQQRIAGRIFDEWLAEHDLETRRQAIDDAYVAVVEGFNQKLETYARDEKITTAATGARAYAEVHFGNALRAITALRTPAAAVLNGPAKGDRFAGPAGRGL
jgi:hypothetical protein